VKLVNTIIVNDMLLSHEWIEKKDQSGNYKKKRKEKKYKQERRDCSSITLSLFFWMFLWIIDDYPGTGIGWILFVDGSSIRYQ